MEYYYALLENYKQLKRREFKLSLREEEEGEALSDEEKVNQLIAAAGESKEKAQKFNGFNLWKGQKSTGERGEDGALKYEPSDSVTAQPENEPDGQSAMIVDNDKKLGKGKTALKYLSQIFGGKDKDDSSGAGAGGDGDGGDGDETKPDAAAIARRDAAVANLGKQLEGMSESDFTPEYEETIRKNRQQSALDLAKAQAAGQTKGGEGVGKSALYEGSDLQDKVISSPEIPPEKVADSCEALSDSLALVKRVRNGEEVSPDELRDIGSRVEVTVHGVAYEGVYHQVRARSTIRNDPFMNNMKVLNDKIKEHNRKNPDDQIPEILPKQESNTGRLLAQRGPMLEQVAVIDALATAISLETDPAKRAELEQELRQVLESTQGERTMEEVREIFQKGLCAQASQCLLDIESTDNITLTNTVLTYLTGVNQATGEPVPGYEGPGLTQEKAEAMVRAVADSDDPRAALSLLVLSTRGFNNAYEGLGIIRASQEGGKDANIPGTKTDVLRVVSAESFEEFAKQMEENRTPIEAAQAKAAECAGDGVGMSSMRRGGSSVKEDIKSEIMSAVAEVDNEEEETTSDDSAQELKDGEVALDTEQKSMDRTTGRVKSGEQSIGRFREFCKNRGKEAPEEMTEKQKKEREFVEANTRRLKNCVDNGEATKGSFGEHASAEDAACAFQEKLDDSPVLKAFSALRDDPDAVKDENGDPLKHTGAALVDQWYESASKSNDKDAKKAKERRKLAKSGLAKKPEDRTKDENEAISKIEESLEAAETSRLMDADTDDQGKVSGESLGYILTRHSQSAGSLGECMKDVRGYEDGDQRFGLVNENTYGSLGMVGSGDAVVRRKKGTSSYSIETTGDDPTVMVGGGFERGQLVTKVNPRTMSQPKKWKKGKEEATREELFMAFLTGQMNLLEKIMNQTKNGPSI